MLHKNPHRLAGQTVRIAQHIPELGGEEFIVEDYWDRISGRSWSVSDGSLSCCDYAFRIGMRYPTAPPDDEVLYGKVRGLGKLVHVSELERIT